MFKVGDTVWVPHSITGLWEPHVTIIKAVETYPNADTNYTVDLPYRRLALREELHIEEFKYEAFQVFDNLAACKKFIKDYYYDGLCNGCQYEELGGAIWRCATCGNTELVATGKPKDFKRVCKRTGLTVGLEECCKFFEPKTEAARKEYVSWEHYEDILRNCDFNPNCIHHQKSANHCCSYDFLLGCPVHVCVSFDCNGRKVQSVLVPRKMWIDQSYIDGDNITCRGLRFEPILTKVGLIKKGTEPGVSFGELKTIDIKTGQFVE